MKKKLLRIFVVICGAYLLICAGVFWFQERLIFIPTRQQIDAPQELMIESVYFEAQDGVSLHA